MFQKLKQLFVKKADRSLAPIKEPSANSNAESQSVSVGKGAQFRVAFSNPNRSWEESVDLVAILMEVLALHGVETVREGNTLRCTQTGLAFTPEIASFQPLDEGAGATAATIITVAHSEVIPKPIFEWQHSSASTIAAGIRQGFEQWCTVDLPVLQDALRSKLETCTHLQLEFPNRKIPRRVVLGPIMVAGGKPGNFEEASELEGKNDQDHDFCPCCFLTKNADAFQSLLSDNGFHAIRVFAMRNAEGEVQADCRVNGEDFAAGKESIIKYAETWPDHGFEFRKQYILIQDLPQIAQ